MKPSTHITRIETEYGPVTYCGRQYNNIRDFIGFTEFGGIASKGCSCGCMEAVDCQECLELTKEEDEEGFLIDDDAYAE